MNIKILGTGCPNCQRLEANVRQAVKELGLEAEISKVTEISEILGYGVMGTPALAVDDEVKVFGRVAGTEEIKEILKKC